MQGPETGATFKKGPFGRQKPVGTEERQIKAVEGAVLTLDRPLQKVHRSEEWMRCEVANLTRNVVIESADPAGVRGHTMYHHGSSGGISYAEFRHMGKEGILGKYAIHFHLVRDTMRGSGVTGARAWFLSGGRDRAMERARPQSCRLARWTSAPFWIYRNLSTQYPYSCQCFWQGLGRRLQLMARGTRSTTRQTNVCVRWLPFASHGIGREWSVRWQH